MMIFFPRLAFFALRAFFPIPTSPILQLIGPLGPTLTISSQRSALRVSLVVFQSRTPFTYAKGANELRVTVNQRG